MILRYLILAITTIIFTAQINKVSGYERLNDKDGEKNTFQNLNLETGSKSDTSLMDSFVFQEINYYAPSSEKVYLVWNPENYSSEKALSWNENTKLNNGLLYTPMFARGDTLSIKLKAYKGTILQYYFWITKNKKGQYQDFWDLQSSGKTIITGDSPINKDAIYSKDVKEKSSQIVDLGWIILILLIIIYIIVLWLYKKWGSDIEKPSMIKKVLFTGISLVIFHALARSEIIGINPLNMIHYPALLTKIIKAGLSDFFYIFCLVLVFMVILMFVKSIKIGKLFYRIFIFLALFSTLVAYVNITTVLYLGKPFNYQWLYYSDFLGSEESKSAISANLSLSTVLNLISFCISMLLLSGALLRINRMLELHKKVQYITYSILGLMLIVLGYKSVKTTGNWTKGQSENPITCMIYSVITINSNSSFFTAEIPENMASFDPAQSTAAEKSIEIPENHNVKNVLFIVLESAGAVYFDGYGGTYNLSPNLNRYANQALMFDKAYAHAPATNRSLVAILGSIYPYISYKSLTQEAPQLNHPTISSVLKEKGYRTSFFSSANLNFQNCREFLAYREIDRIEDFSTINCVEKFQLDGSDYKEGNGIDDICLSDCLFSWLDEDSTKNFFSLIWTVQGHYPYFFSGVEEDFGVSDYNFNRYLNALKHNDELVGRVMNELERRGLDKTTLVVVVGDHGEAFGQHKQYGHGTSVYEENLRVPLYFINSALFNGEHKKDIAGMKDLSTTTLSIIGVEAPEIWQGRNLLNTNSNETFFFAPWSDYLFGYRKDNMKFIFNETLNKIEVYDLNIDPEEKNNLIESDIKSEVEFARNQVSAWVQHQNKFIKKILKEQ